jgi:hypothetical protein
VIHAAAADERALAGCEAEVCEEVGAWDGDGGVIRGCGGTVGQSASDAAGVDLSGFGQGGE